MDWSLLLGILGIVVSIVVGWLTYGLADRRARSQRYFTAKSTVLQELSKSLGEDSVPPPNILEATIRSVLREVGDPRVQINVSEVLDDLMRQVTSDPFLDSERRRKLQTDIETVRTELVKRPLQEEQPEEDAIGDTDNNFRLTLVPAFVGIAAAVGTLIFLTSILRNPAEGSRLSEVMGIIQSRLGGYGFWLLESLLLLAFMGLILILLPIDKNVIRKIADVFGGKKKT